MTYSPSDDDLARVTKLRIVSADLWSDIVAVKKPAETLVPKAFEPDVPLDRAERGK